MKMNSKDERFFESWLERRKSRLAEGTYSSEQSATTALKEFLEVEGVGLADIDFLLADNFISYLTNEKGLADNTTVNYYSKVKQLYEYYIKVNKLDKTNPFPEVDVSHLDYESPDNEKITLEEEEVRALVESMTEARSKALFGFMATTGARIGEAIRLEMDDLDLQERSATIITLKNDNQDERTVYFDRRARRYLNEYVNNGYRSQYPNDDSEYVFITRVAERMSRDRGRVLFNDGVENCEEIEDKVDTNEKAGGNERSTITSHILRRSYAQNWIDSGGDIMTLKNVMGWSDLETAKQYLNDEVDKDKVDRYGMTL
ncbi:tyrosine-type recombinase/integrase [Halovenus sp. WSH3]|uniref:Tyrosine-type recombinase/integrase n=1 Tax=Halovenus carboxidivorans TaxID=2692199 RepID=A0A6B0T3Y9_9EURY|nr:tyrosine-type recombinase/integrase [Halovenus carboxidivorans]MXR50193.1 tyrosine-type recombinase/integrase [Halovenus carboxidivorans]